MSPLIGDLTEVQRDVQALAREFAQSEIAPRAAEWNAAHHVPREIFPALAEAGLFGVAIPEELGGSGLDHTSLCLVIEQIARADAGVSVTVAAQNSLVASPIMRFGTDGQKERWLRHIASGEVMASYALTEPDAGSDAASLRTMARPVGGGWTLHGTKTWITNGGIASLFVVFARTGEGTRGITAFLAEPGDGLVVGREMPKMGLHTSSTVELSFDGLAVESGSRLGDDGQGFGIALSTLDGGRVVIAAQACGIAQAALDVAVQYATERTAFGGPIARFQGVQFPIADIAARLDAARLLMLHAARLRDAGLPHGPAGAKAKLVASRVAVDAADVAVQTLGGYGFSSEYPAERLYRDAKITELYEGTSEIQRIVIARSLFGDAAR